MPLLPILEMHGAEGTESSFPANDNWEKESNLSMGRKDDWAHTAKRSDVCVS